MKSKALEENERFLLGGIGITKIYILEEHPFPRPVSPLKTPYTDVELDESIHTIIGVTLLIIVLLSLLYGFINTIIKLIHLYL